MSRFTSVLRIVQDPKSQTVKLAIATSENRVDEISVPKGQFLSVAESLWSKSDRYEGCELLQAKYNPATGFFSLSVKTGPNTRSVYRFYENQVMPAVGRYMADSRG